MKSWIKEHPYLTTFLILVILFTIRYLFTVSIMKKQIENEVNTQLNGGN